MDEHIHPCDPRYDDSRDEMKHAIALQRRSADQVWVAEVVENMPTDPYIELMNAINEDDRCEIGRLVLEAIHAAVAKEE